MLKRGDKALVRYKKKKEKSFISIEEDLEGLCEIIAIMGRPFKRVYLVWNYEEEERVMVSRNCLYKLNEKEVKKMLELQTAKKKGD